jgi:hypothetical protein
MKILRLGFTSCFTLLVYTVKSMHCSHFPLDNVWTSIISFRTSQPMLPEQGDIIS